MIIQAVIAIRAAMATRAATAADITAADTMGTGAIDRQYRTARTAEP